MDKKSGKANRSGKRVVRDLTVSDAATPGVKGGVPIFNPLSSAVGQVMNNFAGALLTAAKGA